MRIVADRELTTADLIHEFLIDAEIGLSEINWDLENMVERLAPFGEGNRQPIFATKGLQLVGFETMGLEGKHLRLSVREPSTGVTKKIVAFGWGKIASELKIGGIIDIAYTVGVNEWNGNRELQLRLEDLVLVDV